MNSFGSGTSSSSAQSYQFMGWAKIKHAARYAGISEKVMREWVNKHGLPHSRINKQLILIKLTDIDDFLSNFRGNNDDHVCDVATEMLNKVHKKH